MHLISPSLEADLVRAASMLKELPAEIGNGFLAPLIKDIGWPFQSIQDSLNGTDWLRIMDPFTLEQFAQLRWRRKTFFLEKRLLHPVSKNDIRLVIRNLTEDFSASLGWYAEHSRQSLLHHRQRVLSTRDFCAPVTLALTPIGFKVLDGNHRVAALFSSGLAKAVPLEAWIGTPNSDV